MSEVTKIGKCSTDLMWAREIWLNRAEAIKQLSRYFTALKEKTYRKNEFVSHF